MEEASKVAILAPSLAEAGGVSAVAEFLCGVMDQADLFDYDLISIPSSSRDSASVRLMSPSSWLRGILVEEGEWQGRYYRHVGSFLAELEFQRYQPRRQLTRKLEECDLIQVVAGSPAWALVAKRANRPVALQVATFAAVEREERFRQEGGLVTAWRRLMTRVTDRLDRKALREVDRVFVENRWMQETAAKWTDPENVVLAPPGVDTEFFRPSSGPSTSGTGPILSVARFEDRRKNLRLLFEAYAELCAGHDDPPSLVLAGKSGPRPEDWRRAEELGIRHRVQFHEHVERSTLAELYREASLFVLSSSEEGLGIVLLEAMASGLPVVSTATEGAREAVDDGVTGILTPVGDGYALTRAMSRLLVDETLRRRMGSKGRIRAENRYSRDAAGRRFLTGYRELLGMDLGDSVAAGLP